MDVKFNVREIEVIKLTSIGFTKSQIAGQLHISSHTVDYHVRNILRKTNSPNLVAAVVKAIKCNHIKV